MWGAIANMLLQRLFLNSLLWRDSVHFLQEHNYVKIENRKGTFVSSPFSNLKGLKEELERKVPVILEILRLDANPRLVWRFGILLPSA